MEQTLRVLEAKTDDEPFDEGYARCSLQENPGLDPSAEPGWDPTGSIERDYYPRY